VQFAARFGLTIEKETWNAMRENAHLIDSVSPERISIELAKLMTAPKPSVGFDLMHECGLLARLLPELEQVRGISQDKMPGDDVYGHTMRVLDAARNDKHLVNAGDLDLLFAALLHDIGKARTSRRHPTEEKTVFFGHQLASARLAKRWMKRIKIEVTGVDIPSVLRLIENHMFDTKSYFTDRAIRRFIAKIGPELIYKLTDLRLSDNRGGKHPNGINGVLKLRKRIEEEMAKKPPFGPKDLAINGHDIISLGMPEGPMIGRILQAIVEHVLDKPQDNNRDKLLALVNEISENPSLADKLIAQGKERSDDLI
jgi:putative nucleotidyltransferase with HDIG domain